MIPGAARAVVVLGAPDTGPYAPKAFWPSPHERSPQLAEIAERALAERRGVLTRHAQDGNVAEAFPNAIAYPLLVDGHAYGVVAVEMTRSTEAELQSAMRRLQWGTGWLEGLVRRQQAALEQATRESLVAALDLVAAVLDEEGFEAAARALVTQLALKLDCDRVSLGVVRNGHARVAVLSHSAEFGRHMNLINAIGAAMDEALDQHATIVYPPPPGAWILVTRAHGELARAHGSDCIVTAALPARGGFAGALTLERPGIRPFDAAAVELIESAGAMASPILHAQRLGDMSVPAYAAQRWLARARALLGPRHYGAKLAGIAVVAAIAFLSVATATYRVTAHSILEGSVRRAVVAPFDGYLATASVRAGDTVRKDAPLAALDVRDINLERLKWASQYTQHHRQYQEAVAAHDRAKAQIAEAQFQQAQAQLDLIAGQLARAVVAAPYDGIVVSGDLSQQLGSPLRRGQVLFEVAPLNAYRLVLDVDEGEINYVREGQRGSLVLASIADESFPFTVERITPVTTAKEGRNTFRVEALLERNSDRLRPGMEGVGKIEVEERKLVWIWSRKLVDWLRLTLWTWWP
jgi:multidrug efflux pump subunit AcrA (membrane-fusion protein)